MEPTLPAVSESKIKTDLHHHPRAVGDVHSVALSMVPRTSGTVLDAAAGDCWFSRCLMDIGFEVVSADRHFAVTPPGRYLEIDFNEGLPLDDASLDGVTSVETIEHLENPWAFLREVGRILRPGGFLVVSTPNVSSVFSRLLFAVKGTPIWFQACDLSPLGHISPIFWHLLTEMTSRAGFRLAERRYSVGRVPLISVPIPLHSAQLGESVVARFVRI